jgi:hypothetical protein
LLVSIVVNNHNYGRYLAQAIDSALAQTHPECEVIVVDDGSTDESREVIERYGDAVTAVLKENGGQGSACNAGFERCTGDVVIFLDSDDMLEPTIAASIVDVFAERPGLAKVQCRLALVDADGRPLGDTAPPAHVRMPSGDLRRYVARANFTWWTPSSGQAFAAAALRRLFPVPEAVLEYGVDTYLQPTAAMLGEIVSLDSIGGSYRRHGSNYTLPSDLDLDNIRSHLVRARDVHRFIKDVAMAADVQYPETALALDDVIFLSQRVVSLKLEPDRHPLDGDRLSRAALQGARAAWTRPDIGAVGRALHACWFLAMLLAPKRLAAALATRLFYPSSRGPSAAAAIRLLSTLPLPHRAGRRAC